MSRIGNQPIPIPAKVAVTVKDCRVRVKGPLGEMEHDLPEGIRAESAAGVIQVSRSADTPEMRRLHGVTRAHLANKVKGVSDGHTISLIVNGKGFSGEVKGKIVEMQLGFSSRMLVEIPSGLKVVVQPGQNTFTIVVSGINKDLVGSFASILYRIRPVEPYNLIGFRYSDQQVRRKAAKTTK
jgi:large subunit ribosomal protein L6